MFIYGIQTALVVLRRLTLVVKQDRDTPTPVWRCGPHINFSFGICKLRCCTAAPANCRVGILGESSIIAFCSSICRYNHGDREYKHNNVCTYLLT